MMYRILIVDDEPYVADSMEDLLSAAYSGKLDVCKGYSADEAISMLARTKVDIVLTDVRMPGMSGLELHKEIIKRWPACKVIFLTGYDDFGYVQSSLRVGGVVDFILKMEEDDKVLAAVDKAIEEIEVRMDYSKALQQARYKLKEAFPLLQQEYWLQLLRDSADSVPVIGKQFAELDIAFRAEEPVLVVVGKVDRWQEELGRSDKSLLLYAAANIAEELFGPELLFAQVNWDYNSLVYFLQPGDGWKQMHAAPWNALHSFAWGMLEAIQSSCSRYLKLSLSVAVAGEPASWSAVGVKADTLKFILSSEAGKGAEMALIDERVLFASRASEAQAPYAARAQEQQLRYKLKSVGMLEAHLERGEEEAFMSLYQELAELVETAPVSLRLEYFYSMSVLFLSCINRRDTVQLLPAGISLDKLTDLKLHASWKEAVHYFAYVAGQLFLLQQGERGHSHDHLIGRLHEHIRHHLREDLSLPRLAELVHLHPFYLSRLYAKLTGESLSDFITRARMDKAKELLTYSDMKIHEISSAVGYEFAPSFSRIFKKLWGMTPQEFRDQSNR
ncbi:two-component system, response regulator YesN [Paenibacillus sp. UNCCL117]|uniref:response regulator transcription factor n=1 Tax=unclassified Paenibacillus TaxID=185978 RepID=UPI00088F37B8|nr:MULTISPECIES: response regulator [unclassified Paenibacillus]SDE26767.1 two-component system, response regulator YesN [Paenibacillus sp. cl123]SFW62695.1 two-component system, response regulator YesN [Paenibacillus sp. UNCCL117]